MLQFNWFRTGGLLAAALVAWVASPVPVRAEEGPAPALTVDLNRTDTNGESCRLTFVVRNTLDQTLDTLVLETVLFTVDGQVAMMTLFDFGEIPSGVPRVRQFAVPDTTCDRVQSVLVNGVNGCVVGGAASDVCKGALKVTSTSDVEMLG